MGVLRGHGRRRPRMVRSNQDGDPFSSEDEAGFVIIDPPRDLADQSDGSVSDFEIIDLPRTRPNRRRRAPAAGQTLTLKKGRRSRHRYENELSLLADIEEEDLTNVVVSGCRTGARFSELMESEELLDKFIEGNDDELDDAGSDVEPARVPPLNGFDDPDEAFLRLGGKLRNALKKHLPMGMVTGIEEDICTQFRVDPKGSVSLQSLSSYERLLAHACSKYHHLSSKSIFDGLGGKVMKIENPSDQFFEVRPSLASFISDSKPVNS